MKKLNLKIVSLIVIILIAALSLVLYFNKNNKDIYSVGNKRDDGQGVRYEITKREGDFYCEVMHFYDINTKKDQLSADTCSKINGPTFYNQGDSVDCDYVLKNNVPKELSLEIDKCYN